ncbi:MAG TPA: ATP-binding protein [Polyangiaceae bacterium]|jgi:serine/threonine-protein kinase RsbT
MQPAPRTLSVERLPIRDERDVVVVRSRVRELAETLGFDPFAAAAVTTAASELARNAWCHGHGGHAVLEQISDGTRKGIRAAFCDQGPGIADMRHALEGGSTGQSLGLGLSGSRRLVDDLAIETARPRGTAVTIVKWARY